MSFTFSTSKTQLKKLVSQKKNHDFKSTVMGNL